MGRQREPADVPASADRNGGREAGPTDERDERRRVADRPDVRPDRYPVPARSRRHPTSVVIRSPTPGLVRDPAPAPGVLPGPASGAVGLPIGRHSRRAPAGAVSGDLRPGPVLIEVVDAGDVGVDIAARAVVAGAPRARRDPLVPGVGARERRDVVDGRVDAVDRHQSSRARAAPRRRPQPRIACPRLTMTRVLPSRSTPIR